MTHNDDDRAEPTSLAPFFTLVCSEETTITVVELIKYNEADTIIGLCRTENGTNAQFNSDKVEFATKLLLV
jgi:hypothetical protein